VVSLLIRAFAWRLPLAGVAGAWILRACLLGSVLYAETLLRSDLAASLFAVSGGLHALVV
jgi:hypothetical protein